MWNNVKTKTVVIIRRAKERSFRPYTNGHTYSIQQVSIKRFFGSGCLKSSTHVVRLGFVYASMYLFMWLEISVLFKEITFGDFWQLHLLIDVVSCGEVWRTTPDVMIVLGLIHSNVVHQHGWREDQVLEILEEVKPHINYPDIVSSNNDEEGKKMNAHDSSKIRTDAQIHNHVL